MTNTVKLSWKDVAYPHALIGDIDKMRKMACDMGYRMFAWNGRVYDVSLGATIYLEEDVK